MAEAGPTIARSDLQRLAGLRDYESWTNNAPDYFEGNAYEAGYIVRSVCSFGQIRTCAERLLTGNAP